MAANNSNNFLGTPSPTVIMQKLFESKLGADVQFRVGTGEQTEVLSAHSEILATASPVFEAMFRFDADKGGNVIKEVPDVTVDAFRLMLQYIYTSSTEGLNADNVFPTLYTAKKYDIEGLRKACVNFQFQFTPENALTILAQADFYAEPILLRRCLQYIDQNTDAVFRHLKDVRDMDPKLLGRLLDRDTLNIGEHALFVAINDWVRVTKKNGGVWMVNENRRQIFDQLLGTNFLYKIRFPLINSEKFLREIVPLGLLSAEEVNNVLIHHLGHHHLNRGMPFCTKKRANDGGTISREELEARRDYQPRVGIVEYRRMM